MLRGKRQAAGLPVEVVLAWMLFAVVTTEILVTYSRIPFRELYHVSGSGIEGGLSRALVFVNFPVALVALGVLALIYRRLPGRSYRAVAILAGVLCAVVFWPGVVKASNLDARPVNAVAALGVLLTLLLSDVVGRRGGLSSRPWHRADWLRIALAVALLVAALPWLGADLGLSDVTVPRLSVAWSLIVIAAVALWALWVRLVDWSGDEESPLRTEPDRLPARR